ncbi:MAG: hypothetical protein H0W88_00295 [Parachlamydiaceae bacterium]|nr:hypothetical protein [Parachlamydiaceae bacterium]
MKAFKLSSILLFSFFMMGIFTTDLSAGCHSSFCLSLNLAPRPAPVAYVQPAPVYVAQPYPYYAERVYYPAPAYQEVVVRRPYAERVYVQPHYHHAHYSYWR